MRISKAIIEASIIKLDSTIYDKIIESYDRGYSYAWFIERAGDNHINPTTLAHIMESDLYVNVSDYGYVYVCKDLEQFKRKFPDGRFDKFIMAIRKQLCLD